MQKRVAIVTGAAGTIGQGAVRRLLAQERKVVLVDRDVERLSQVQKTLSAYDDVHGVAVDLAQPSAPEMVAESIKRHGWMPASIIINNAAISIKHDGYAHNVENISIEEWNLMFLINVTAPMTLVRQFLPFMREQKWGRIVNLASRAGRYNPNQAGPAYAATKAAVLGLSRSIANDFSQFGITCNSVAPGLVISAMSSQFAPEMMKALLERTPVGRGGTAEEIGSAIAYLASEDAGFITGTCFDVNGGQSMS